MIAWGGKVLEVRVSDKLTHEDYEQLVPEFERLAKQNGKFYKPFTTARIRYFDRASIADAQAWLAQN